MQTTPPAEQSSPTAPRTVLVAAAPDLLAALVAMEREFGRTYLPGSSTAVDAARAAIAKATESAP